MADCVSLLNAAELVKELRNHAEYCDMPFSWMNEAYARAADAIEALVQENAKLKSNFEGCYAANEYLFAKLENMKAERDAAIEDLRDSGSCCFCKHIGETDYCERGCRWEWRGVKEKEDARETNSGDPH